ncbi:hypothetical protein N9933_01130 [bacterium]|nr:hypothetical protein [bacterium]
MSCKYEYNGKWYTKEELLNRNAVLTNPKIKPSYDKMINLMDNTIGRLEKRLDEIYQEKQKSSTNKVRLKQLISLENETIQALEGDGEFIGLKKELLDIKDAPPLSKLIYYIKKDFKRLEAIVEADNFIYTDEAKETIDFYKHLDPTIGGDKHPFYSREQIRGKGTKILSEFEPILEQFKPFIDRARELEDQLEERNYEKSMTIINSDPAVEETYGRELKEEDVFFKKSGLGDINWMTMFLQDPTFQFGITSKNSILTDFSKKILSDATNMYRAESQELINTLTKLEPELAKKHTKKKGMLRSIDFGDYQAIDKDGLRMKSILQRFSIELYTEEADEKELWKERSDEIANMDNMKIRGVLISALKLDMFNWYRERYHFFDIRKIQSIRDTYPELFKDDKSVSDSNYEKKMKSLLGEIGYKEELEKQDKKIREYIVQSELNLEDLEVQNLSQDQFNKKRHNFRSKYDPLDFLWRLDHFDKVNGESISPSPPPPNLLNYKRDLYIHKIPRKTFGVLDKEGIHLSEGNEETGYYDERFKEIEADKDKKAFHNLLLEFYADVYNNSHPEDRKRFGLFELPIHEKTLREILSNPELGWMATFSEAIKFLLEEVRNMFTEHLQNNLSFAYVNPITGKPGYQVNNEFLQFNKRDIDAKYLVEKLRIEELLPGDISFNNTVDMTKVPRQVLEILTTNLGLEVSLQALQRRFPNNNLQAFPLKRLLNRAVTHNVVVSRHIDLPKMLRSASHAFALYKARQDMLPILSIFKSQYEKIEKPKTTKHGAPIINVTVGDDEKVKELGNRTDGFREHAISQYDSWFKRAVLGDNSKILTSTPILNKAFSAIGIKGVDSRLTALNNKFKKSKLNKGLQGKDNELLKDIDSLLSSLEKKMKDPEHVMSRGDIRKKIRQLEAVKTSRLRHLSGTAMIENLVFKTVRFLGLGYNLSSAATNFFEGQFSNTINAASGKYFPEEFYWEAVDIVKYSAIRNMSFHMITSNNSPVMKEKLLGAELVRVMIDNWDILQDAYNELQKATSQSSISHLGKLHPKEITSRVEFLNQAPVVIAVLKDVRIKNSKGEKTSLWDAFMAGAKEEGKELGQLSEEFATPYNKYNFEILPKKEKDALGAQENMDRVAFNSTKSRLTDTIVKFHGDYSELGGNKASETIPGLSVLMFKRWLGSYLYNRFAPEQHNLNIRGKEKGRYRSFTGASAALHGGVAGFTMAGPYGALMGAGIGLVSGAVMPSMRATKMIGESGPPIIGNLTLIQEMALHTNTMIARFIGMPVNFIAGKRVVKNNILPGSVAKDWTSKFEKKYDPLDVANIRSNLAELSILLWLTAILLMVKGIAWDDDDEADSSRRKMHNLFVNKMMQLSGQSISFLNPAETYDNFLSTNAIAPLRFTLNISKTMKEVVDYVNGEDILGSGINAGESALWNQTVKTWAPAPFKSFGFDSGMSKQFTSSHWDKMFWEDTKRARAKRIIARAEFRSELKSEDKLSKKEIEKLINDRFPPG